MKFCERLLQARQNAGLGQAEAAVKLQIGASTLRLYETGQRRPQSDLLVRLCKLYDCSADYLLGIGGETPVQPVDVPDELRGEASAFMKAAASLCELENNRSFSRSLLPVYRAILQTIHSAIEKADGRFRELVGDFPQYEGSDRPGELPEDLRLAVLSQVAAGSVDQDLQKVVKAGRDYGNDVEKELTSAALKVSALIRQGILCELAADRSPSFGVRSKNGDT